MKSLNFKIILTLFIFLSIHAYPQVNSRDVLLTIGGKGVTVNEFMAIYQKNNIKGESMDKKSLDEYLELFINFKLKVREAEDLGLDTLTSFRTELNGYRDQLAKPYFTDEATVDRLINEAYERSLTDLRASHIFFRLAADALPADTLLAFQKAVKVKERLKNGESFEKLAVELSEDPSAKDREANQQHPYIKGNRGDLGYFTVFDMVYPFESAAYNLKVGEVSEPIRTEYGFHVIKLTARKPAMGKVTVAHIFISIAKNATAQDSARAKARIDSIYTKLQSGSIFEDLVKTYSDDKGSAAKGGVLPKFGVNRMVPEFIDAITLLNLPGDYSTPILTPYGWHIIKLVDKKGPGKLEEDKMEIKQRLVKDVRGNQSKEVVLERIKKEYQLTENKDALKEFYTVVTDSIFLGKWDVKLAKNLTKNLFKIGNLTIRQQDFTEYLGSKQRKKEKENIESYINKMYKDFLNENMVKWENSMLEQKYPEFKALMNEYRDGILLFDLTDQKVWSKAVKDTTGLKEFYEKNKRNYMWGTRLDASICTVKKAKDLQKVKNFLKSGLDEASILKEVNTDSLKVLSIESGKFSRKENRIIDTIAWTPGFSKEMSTDSGIVFVMVKNVLKPEPKALNEARGLITADYQNYLETAWISSLRAKYPVNVNKEVLAKIK
jgi:peptidyl-prolyl cis-trans isomerase SurA